MTVTNGKDTWERHLKIYVFLGQKFSLLLHIQAERISLIKISLILKYHGRPESVRLNSSENQINHIENLIFHYIDDSLYTS